MVLTLVCTNRAFEDAGLNRSYHEGMNDILKTVHSKPRSGKVYTSNSDRLYSQWLTGVSYWLVNHCKDWRDVIYHIQPCNVDNRRPNVGSTTSRRSKRTKKMHFSPNKRYEKC